MLGMTMAGLNWPVPHGLFIYEVINAPKAYRTAPIAVAAMFNDVLLFM